MSSSEVRHRQYGQSSGFSSGHPTETDKHSVKQSHGSRSSLLLKLTVISAVATLLAFLSLYALYSTSANYPLAYSLPDPPRLDGPLKPNSYLAQAERLFEGKLEGPESIVRQGEHTYTGTSDGRVLHIHKGEIRTLARLGQPPCGGYENEPTCGRPLGMRLDADGYLIVCDAYLGIFKINVATGDKHLLLPSGVNIDGRPLRFINDLDIDTDGFIYFTDSSTYQRRDFSLDIISGRGTGRLLRYDPLHNTTEILLDQLNFANGVQLSRYGDYLLVSETARARILKYDLKGVNARQRSVFAENLPCLPDNIRSSSSGGYWVACGVTRYQGKSFNSMDFSASKPLLRWILSLLPPEWITKIGGTPSSMILELNAKGKIVRSLMDLEGQRVQYSSEVEDDGGILYIGSFSRPYIARINTNKQLSSS